MSGDFYSDNTGYNAKQLNIQSGTMRESVAFESFKFELIQFQLMTKQKVR